MNFMELAEARHSTKKFSDRKLEDEKLQKILEAGNLAPTAKNSQPHRIYVLRSEEALEKAAGVTPCVYGASTVLLFTYNTDEMYVFPGGSRQDSGMEDCAIVATHMMLEAEELGVASCWVNRFNPSDASEIFDLPDNERPALFMDLGYPAEGAGPLPKHFKKKALDEIVTYL